MISLSTRFESRAGSLATFGSRGLGRRSILLCLEDEPSDTFIAFSLIESPQTNTTGGPTLPVSIHG